MRIGWRIELMPMKTQCQSRLFLPCLLLLAGLLGWPSTVQAAHTAFVFNTDGAPLPGELSNAINARGGAGTVMVEIRPNSTNYINGIRVVDRGTITLPR